MKYFIISFVCVVGIITSLSPVFATDVKDKAIEQLQAGGVQAGYGEEAQDPRVIAARAIQMFLGLIGTIFTFLFVYSGYLLITSHGEEDKITKARKTMMGAVIGLFVTLLAFSITYFIGTRVREVTGVGSSSIID
ncbi:MAG TPA: hypothetical protein DCS29_02005 [Candidatus Magasanikbacteria bacterium]|nr:MAG: hypothetical protein A2479_00320 [Candidatus Magasanikbacteria bacterium RIFOXYC2_FULL_39_8]HAT03531.1 hypothetical protein [Candidatus Magasanikbacteria bacterium]